MSFFFFANDKCSIRSATRQRQQQTVATSGPTRTRVTDVQTPGARGPDVAQRVRGRPAEGLKRARPDNEAEETGHVRVNLHESLDQQGSGANERAHPPVLKAVSGESIAKSSPGCRPKTMFQRVLVGWRVILLGDSEDVQGERAAQVNHELIHVGEPGQQHKRDEGVGTQKQECVVTSTYKLDKLHQDFEQTIGLLIPTPEKKIKTAAQTFVFGHFLSDVSLDVALPHVSQPTMRVEVPKNAIRSPHDVHL